MIDERAKVQHPVPAWVWWVATGLIVAFLAWENFPREGSGNAKDWRFFFPAAEALLTGTDLYESGINGQVGYVYPPFLAFLVTPLVPLGFVGSSRVWLGLGLGALTVGVVLTAREVVRRLPAGWCAPRLGPPVLLGLFLSLDLARRELEHTQTDWITLLGFVLGLLWMDRRPLLAGAALGFAANVKYHTLIVVPYLILRGRWRAAGATMGFALAGALLPATLIGWDRNLEYLGRAFGGIAQFVGVDVPRRANVWEISSLDSVSVTSALSRLAEGLGGHTRLTLALTGTAAAACVGLAWWMYRANGFRFWGFMRIGVGSHGPPRRICDLPAGRGEEKRAEAVEAGHAVAPGVPGPLVLAAEWMGLMVATVAFSPQTLKRHMFLLVPVYIMTAVLLLARRRAGVPGSGGPVPRAGKGVLLAGLAISILALVLPPRTQTVEAASNAWRAVGGPSWGLLVWFFALLWTALTWDRGARSDRAVA